MPEIILQWLGPLLSAVGVYVGIRADLARLNERTTNTQKACDHAHHRLDALVMRCTP